MTDQIALGRGGLRVGRYGFGGAPIAGLFESVSDDRARECIGQAWSAGQRYFDTAPHYGALSEHRVRAFLAQKPSNEWVLSTKVGRLIETANPRRNATFNYEPAASDVLAMAVQIDAVCSRHGVPIEDSSRFIATPMPEQLWADPFAAELLRPGAPGPGPSKPTTTHNPPPQKAVNADS